MMNIPQKMQALATTTDGKNINEGSPIQDVVKIREENVPEIRDYVTLVEVRYVGIGSADVTCLRIQHRNTTPGFDLSGVVVKDKSGRFKEGDRVFGMVYGGLGSTLKDEKLRKQYEDNGSFATYAVVHSDMLIRCPEKENFEKCAALPFCTLTAYQAFDLKNWPSSAKNHESILICGGSTMVGLSAIQLAHRMGYRVLTTTSQNHFQLCKDYGADECYNFKDQDIDRQIQEHTQNSLTFAIDAVGRGNSLTIAYKSMGSKGGQISTVIPRDQKDMQSQASGRNDVQVRMRLPTTLWGHEAQWDGIDFKPSSNEHQNTKAFLKDFEKWLQEGKYKCLPTRLQQEHGLDGVLRALEEVRRNPPAGVRIVTCVKDH